VKKIVKTIGAIPPSEPQPKPAPDPVPDDPDQLREQMAKLVRDQASDNVKAAIEKAKTGHYCLTKLLFSLAGLYPAPAKQDGSPDNSLAEIFLRELGVPLPEREPNVLPSETLPANIKALPAPDPGDSLK
jgi:hypothetical protein